MDLSWQMADGALKGAGVGGGAAKEGEETLEKSSIIIQTSAKED